MATSRTAFLAVPAAAIFLLWPALWNGYPIVFADSGTYLSQAIHHYAGWDRPIFYSIFMLPLHAMTTLWPVVVVQALLAGWVLWLVCRVLVPGVSAGVFVAGVGALSVFGWLPWIVSELMPDLFTPLLVLVLCLLASVPERLSGSEQVALVSFAAFMIATQQSSLPLACVMLAALSALPPCCNLAILSRHGPAQFRPSETPRCRGRLARATATSTGVAIGGRDKPGHDRKGGPSAPSPEVTLVPVLPVWAMRERRTGDEIRRRRWLLIILPPALALLSLCTVNLIAHGRFAVSPFGNVFLLARVIYDGPGMVVLRRDCPAANWRLCPFLNSFPSTSDDFLWTQESPLNRAGGPKAVSSEAGAILEAALINDPAGEARAALTNTLSQLTRFAGGDGLNAWPTQVSPWIERDFPNRERASYASARQQMGSLSMPKLLDRLQTITALAGVLVCSVLLPVALQRRLACAGFLLAVVLALPVSAAITGGLSAPHDRYQSRIMWLPPFIAVVSLASLRAPPPAPFKTGNEIMASGATA